MQTKAFAAQSATTPFGPAMIERREPGPRDVAIEILFCGVCHSDLHTARGEWPGTQYPCVPGHEIIGKVTSVGKDVTRFKPGQIVGVGCMVDSCRTCASCGEGLEQYCDGPVGFTGTYNGAVGGGPNTHGGYSAAITVDEHFVLSINHAEKDLAAVAPLLCAGITTWSPLKHWGAGPGKKVGIVGIGGLGHMGVKLSHALGAHTVAFTTSPDKVADAKALGADEVVVSKDEAQMKKHLNSFDMILNTVAAPHNLDAFTLAAQARRHHGAGRRAVHAAPLARGVQSGVQAPGHCRLADRRHSRNPGDAGFLRQARHHLGYRDDQDAGYRGGLCADAQKRREISLCDRHGVTQERLDAAQNEEPRDLHRGVLHLA